MSIETPTIRNRKATVSIGTPTIRNRKAMSIKTARIMKIKGLVRCKD
jgi:hypothetical protein